MPTCCTLRFIRCSAELTPADLDTLLKPTAVPGLRCLVAGAGADGASGELVPFEEMQQLLATLRDMADVIIVDGPPVLAVSEAAVLAAMGLGVVFVVESGETRSESARVAHQALARANACILGVVLNKTRARTTSYYYKHYQRDESIDSSAADRLRRMRADRKRAKA
jgi:hypothetical protein